MKQSSGEEVFILSASSSKQKIRRMMLPLCPSKQINVQNRATIPPQNDAVNPEGEANQLLEDQAEKIARLIVRLKSYGFSHQQALKTVELTGATVESGIWKLLYDLNLMVMDKRVSNPKSYLAKVLKDKYKLDLAEVVGIKS